MSDGQYEESQGPLGDIAVKIFDPMLESKSTANMLIITGVAACALILMAIGFLVTSTISPEALQNMHSSALSISAADARN
jgi:hypothetical protein